MTSKPTENILPMEECKTVFNEASSRNKTYLEAAHVYPGEKSLLRTKWFKGSRDRSFRGALAE